MTRADARGRRAGRSEPGGREDAQPIGWVNERLQQAEACCLAAWVWSRRWIEGVRSATGRHRSRCRLRGPRQSVTERTERAIRGKKRAILVHSRGNSRHGPRGVRGRDTPIVRSLIVLNTRGLETRVRVRCLLACVTYLLTYEHSRLVTT
jgi:hypothetical protein